MHEKEETTILNLPLSFLIKSRFISWILYLIAWCKTIFFKLNLVRPNNLSGITLNFEKYAPEAS